MIHIIKKLCKGCNKEKSLSEFHHSLKTKNGVQGLCKVCKTLWQTNKQQTTEGKILHSISQRKYYIKNKSAQENYRKKYKRTLAARMGRRKNRLLYLYGITQERYNELLKTQDNACAICKIDQKEFKRAFAVDHNHKCCPSGEACINCIRGLLCSKCNNGLGYFNDNIQLLAAASSYLSK